MNPSDARMSMASLIDIYKPRLDVTFKKGPVPTKGGQFQALEIIGKNFVINLP